MNHPLINSINMNKIWKESWSWAPVDVGLSIARPSDPFSMIVYTMITLLQYCGCWRSGDAKNEVIICSCIKPFNPEHPDFKTRNIDFLRKWLIKRICLLFTRDDPLHTISMYLPFKPIRIYQRRWNKQQLLRCDLVREVRIQENFIPGFDLQPKFHSYHTWYFPRSLE